MAYVLMLMTHQTGNGSRSQQDKAKDKWERKGGCFYFGDVGGYTMLAMTNAVADQFLYNLKKQPKDQPVIIKYEHLTTQISTGFVDGLNINKAHRYRNRQASDNSCHGDLCS